MPCFWRPGNAAIGARPAIAADEPSMVTGVKQMCPTIFPSSSATSEMNGRVSPRSASTSSASAGWPKASSFT
jgi:hypothetical protein